MVMRIVLAFVLSLALTSMVRASPLLDAIGENDATAVQAAIAAGADVNQRSGFKTPLIAALRGGNPDIAKLLLNAGADVNLGTNSGTPLAVSCSMARPDYVALLLGAGADPKLAKSGLTPLHFAAEQGCLECARLLIAAGADNNALTSSGTPALHLALLGAHQDVAELLRMAGYSPPVVSLDAAKIAAADPDNGLHLFEENCGGCHKTTNPELHAKGPPLFNVIGRDKASVPDQTYSDALLEAKGAWTYEDLNSFLAAPSAFYPGTHMVLGSTLDEDTRAGIIAYLRTQHDNPPPLP